MSSVHSSVYEKTCRVPSRAVPQNRYFILNRIIRLMSCGWYSGKQKALFSGRMRIRWRMVITGRVGIALLKCDLDEAVAGHAALLHRLPHNRFFALGLVLFPNRAQQFGHDGLGSMRGLEVHPVGQGKVGQEIGVKKRPSSS